MVKKKEGKERRARRREDGRKKDKGNS